MIKPAEAAMFLEPTVVNAFQVTGTPEGVGEMQGFISHREGQEHVHLIEIVEEIPEQLAVIRHVGSNDPAARTTYRLTPDSTGTSLEFEQALTV
ncbi:SRPBCC family protein [Arthrobacter sp. MDT2-16]